MKLRYLKVQNFRGIQSLEWAIPEQPLIAFIGTGDSTKTTILDAIELVLSPRWNITFHDMDFYMGDHTQLILIEATVGELPDSLITEMKFGFHMGGWDGEHVLAEPDDDDEVLTIRLTVDQSLEPEWLVVRDGQDDKRISHKDRERLGMARLGTYIDRDLTWSRGSALSQLTDSGDDIRQNLAQVDRETRRAVEDAKIESLQVVAKTIEEEAARFSVKPKYEEYKVSLDAGSSSIGASLLSLHDGNIPVRQAGFGTKRLLALSAQNASVSGGAIVLIDEVELALEPFRLRQLLKSLQMSDEESEPQNFVTTHSSVVVEELSYEQIFVVRSDDGKTTINSIDYEFKDLTNKVPEALLSKKIIVCEGDTEYGLCERMDTYWQERHGKSFAFYGVSYVSGSGSDAVATARKLAELKYSTLLFGDSDQWTEKHFLPAKDAGCCVVLWPDEVCTEERICLDLPIDGLQDFISAAFKLVQDENSIIDTVCHYTGKEHERFNDLKVSSWIDTCGEATIRMAVGTAAKKRGWFKQRFAARDELAPIVIKYDLQIEDKPLAQTLEELREWAYE